MPPVTRSGQKVDRHGLVKKKDSTGWTFKTGKGWSEKSTTYNDKTSDKMSSQKAQ